jgi:single-strand DNA-binding protein
VRAGATGQPEEETMMAAKALAEDVSATGLVAIGDHRNEVNLVGRLTASAQERELPSGDALVSWRIVVDRPAQQRTDGRRAPTVDALDCVTWRKTVSRSVLSWRVGDTIEVTGSLRRRFWRTERGPVSRTEVEVVRARRIAKAG